MNIKVFFPFFHNIGLANFKFEYEQHISICNFENNVVCWSKLTGYDFDWLGHLHKPLYHLWGGIRYGPQPVLVELMTATI